MYYKSYVALTLIIFWGYLENVHANGDETVVIADESNDDGLAGKKNLTSYDKTNLESIYSIGTSSAGFSKSLSSQKRSRILNDSNDYINSAKSYNSKRLNNLDTKNVNLSKSFSVYNNRMTNTPSSYVYQTAPAPYNKSLSNFYLQVNERGYIVKTQRNYAEKSFYFPNSKQNSITIQSRTDQDIKILDILNNVANCLNRASSDAKNVQSLLVNFYDFQVNKDCLIRTFSNLKAVCLMFRKGSFSKDIKNIFISINDNNAKFAEFCQYFSKFNAENFGDREYLKALISSLNGKGYESIYKIKNALDEIFIIIDKVNFIYANDTTSEFIQLLSDVKDYLKETKENWDTFFYVINNALNLTRDSQKFSKKLENSVLRVQKSSDSIKTEIMRTFDVGNDIFKIFSIAETYLKHAKNAADKLQSVVEKYRKHSLKKAAFFLPKLANALSIFDAIKENSKKLYDITNALRTHKSQDKLNNFDSYIALNKKMTFSDEVMRQIISVLGAEGIQLLENIVENYEHAAGAVSVINTQNAYNGELSSKFSSIINAIKDSNTDICNFYGALKNQNQSYDNVMGGLKKKSVSLTKDDIISGFSENIFSTFGNIKLSLIDALESAKVIQGIVNRKNIGAIKRYKDENPNASKMKDFFNKAKKQIVSALNVEYDNFIVNYFNNLIRLFEALEKPMSAQDIEKRLEILKRSFDGKMRNFYNIAYNNQEFRKLSANSLNNLSEHFSKIEEVLRFEENTPYFRGFRSQVCKIVDESIDTLLNQIDEFNVKVLGK